jgi:23S rRNA (uracil1939-C5)-methyltransferase
MLSETTQKPVANEERVRLILEGMGADGSTYATLDGERVSVFGGIPGEVVVAAVHRSRQRKRWQAAASVVEVVEPSPHRVPTPCPYYGLCSGCDWQHIAYDYQLHLKRQRVADALAARPELAGVVVAETLPSPRQFGYRNHARFTIKQGGHLGYVNRITRRWVRVNECMLMHPWINEAVGKLQGRCAETTQLSIRYGVNTGEWLVQPRLSAADSPLMTGQTHYREQLLDKPFRIASPSFFQVNTAQAERLAGLVRERLAADGSQTVVDAYSGVGTFSALLAQHVRSVIAIEESAAAVKDAAVNTLGLENLEFKLGKTEEVLGTLSKAPDGLILDPPRAGCHPAAIEAAVRLAPAKVVYVSCEPETAARDLTLLVRGGYAVESVEPVDMFPQTHHVECLSTLRLARAGGG